MVSISFDADHPAGPRAVTPPQFCKRYTSYHCYQLLQKGIFITFDEHVADVYTYHQINFFEFSGTNIELMYASFFMSSWIVEWWVFSVSAISLSCNVGLSQLMRLSSSSTSAGLLTGECRWDQNYQHRISRTIAVTDVLVEHSHRKIHATFH